MTNLFRIVPADGGLRAALTRQKQPSEEEKLLDDGFVEVEPGVWQKPG